MRSGDPRGLVWRVEIFKEYRQREAAPLHIESHRKSAPPLFLSRVAWLKHSLTFRSSSPVPSFDAASRNIGLK